MPRKLSGQARPRKQRSLVCILAVFCHYYGVMDLLALGFGEIVIFLLSFPGNDL